MKFNIQILILYGLVLINGIRCCFGIEPLTKKLWLGITESGSDPAQEQLSADSFRAVKRSLEDVRETQENNVRGIQEILMADTAVAKILESIEAGQNRVTEAYLTKMKMKEKLATISGIPLEP